MTLLGSAPGELQAWVVRSGPAKASVPGSHKGLVPPVLVSVWLTGGSLVGATLFEKPGFEGDRSQDQWCYSRESAMDQTLKI